LKYPLTATLYMIGVPLHKLPCTVVEGKPGEWINPKNNEPITPQGLTAILNASYHYYMNAKNPYQARVETD